MEFLGEGGYQYFNQIAQISRSKNNIFTATIPVSNNSILEHFECLLDKRYRQLSVNVPPLTDATDVGGHLLEFKLLAAKFLSIIPSCKGLVRTLHYFVKHVEKTFKDIYDKLTNRLLYTQRDYSDHHVLAYFSCVVIIKREMGRLLEIFNKPAE